MVDRDPSDEVLTARIAAGDARALELLYERHAPWVRAWVGHALGRDRADDALQEVFVRVWRAAPQFDPARSRFTSWLAAITRHHVIRELARGGRREQALAAEAIDSVLARGSVAEDRVEAAARATSRRCSSTGRCRPCPTSSASSWCSRTSWA